MTISKAVGQKDLRLCKKRKLFKNKSQLNASDLISLPWTAFAITRESLQPLMLGFKVCQRFSIQCYIKRQQTSLIEYQI